MRIGYGKNKRVFAILMMLGLLVSCTFVGLADNETARCEEKVETLEREVSQIAEKVAELRNQGDTIETLERKIQDLKEVVIKLRNQIDDLKSKLEKTRAKQAVVATSWFNFVRFYDSYIRTTGTAFVPNEEWNKVRKYALTIYGVDIAPSYLGVDVKTVDDEVAQEHNFTVRRGALITRVYEDTPAGASGLQEGDVILKVDDKKVRNGPQFTGIAWSSAPGTRLEFRIMRNGEFKQVNVEKEKTD